MQMMMRRMGMTTEPIEGVEEVLIRTRDQEIVVREAEVTILTVQGVRTYQVVGTPTTRARTHDAPAAVGAAPASAAPAGPPEEDITLVMEQASVERSEAVEALRKANGEPAEAIMKILSKRGGA
jgi:nascent polypeptide-associated complex subunit alpha